MALLDLIGDSTPPKKSGTVFDLIRESPEAEQKAAEKIRARYERLNKPQQPVAPSNDSGAFLKRLASTVPPRSSSPITAPNPTFDPEQLRMQRSAVGLDQPSVQSTSQPEEPHEFQGQTSALIADVISNVNPLGSLIMKFASLNPVTAGVARAGVAGVNSLMLGIPSAIDPEAFNTVQRQLSTGSKTGDFTADLTGNLAGSVGGLTALTKLGLSSGAAFVVQALPNQTSQVIRGNESIPEAALNLGVDYTTGKMFEAAKPLANELLPSTAGTLRKVITKGAVQAPVGAAQSFLQSAVSGKGLDYGDVTTNALIAGGFGASEGLGEVRSTRATRRAVADEYVKGDIGDRVLQAIGMYEQRVNDPSDLATPRALKSDSGMAAGFAQLTPENIATYSEQVLGKRLSKRQFKNLDYPDQYKVARAMSDGILSKNIQRYGDLEKAIDATAIEWFGGAAGRRKWERGKASRVSDGHDTGDKYISGVREKLGLLDKASPDQPSEAQPEEAQQEETPVAEPATPQKTAQETHDNLPTLGVADQIEPVPLPESPSDNAAESTSVETGQPAFVSPVINEAPILEDYATTGGEESESNQPEYLGNDVSLSSNGNDRQYQTQEQTTRITDSEGGGLEQSGYQEPETLGAPEVASAGGNETSTEELTTIPTSQARVATSDIDVEDRFQYKIEDSTPIGPNWDKKQADRLMVWRDPEDGRLKVVDGFQRFELAKANGVSRVNVEVLPEDFTPAEAQMTGVLKNIANEQGSEIDAARMMRKSGYSLEDLRNAGIDNEFAHRSAKLAALDSDVFHEVKNGRMPVEEALSKPGPERFDTSKPFEYEPFRASDVELEAMQEEWDALKPKVYRKDGEIRKAAKPEDIAKIQEFQVFAQELRTHQFEQGQRRKRYENQVWDEKQKERAENLKQQLQAKGLKHGDEAVYVDRDSVEHKGKIVIDRRWANPFLSLVEPHEQGGYHGGAWTEEHHVMDTEVESRLFKPASSEGLVPPGSLQSVIVPGLESAAEVYQKDVAPALRSAALAVREASQDIHKVLSPSSRGDEAQQTKLIMRDRLSELAMQNDRAESALSDARKAMDQLPTQDKYDFIDRVERGASQATPELNEISKNLRRLLEERKDAIQELGTGKLQSVIENYFPHIWEDPERAKNAFAEAYSKRPFEGSKSFLKQRSIDYFKEGLELGLKPVTDNPVDLTMLKLREMDRYLMAHKVMNEMKEQGLFKFVDVAEKPPLGYTQIDDKVGTLYGAPNIKVPLETIQGISASLGQPVQTYEEASSIRSQLGENAHIPLEGLRIKGFYYAPEKAATLINNYLSPGLREKSGLFRGYLSLANTLNQFQLGYSAFHLGFTSMDAITSQFALGVYKGAHGNVIEGAKTALTAIAAPIKNFRQGSKVMSEWLKPGSQGEEIAHIVEALQKGGGRVKMDTFYKTNAVDNVKKVWKETDHLVARIFRTATRLPFAATELASKPIMEFLVPRMKLGAFFQMAEFELSRSQPALDAMEPAARTAEIRRLMANAWDSVDNRMGQLVYDNLFWNKTTKDLAMASVRSVGWNLGTFRELGGGFIDYGRAIKSLAKREQVEFTHRMAYVAALPVVTGTAGAIFQYLFTGKGPEELKDYFFPKDGGIDEHGNPTRVSLPSYMKDLYAYYKDIRDAATIGGNPARTLVAKTHPLIAVIGEMLENKDFYGTKIRNEDDPFMQQAYDALGHLATVFVPFGARGIARNIDLEGVSSKTFLPEIGITPAPSDLNKSEAQRLMSKYIEESLPQGARTRQAAERSDSRRAVIRRLRMGETPEAAQQFKELVKEGKLAPEDSKTILRDARITPMQSGFKHLDIDKAIKVYEAATPEERKELRPLLAKKWQGKKPASIPPEQYRELRSRLMDAINLPVAR